MSESNFNEQSLSPLSKILAAERRAKERRLLAAIGLAGALLSVGFFLSTYWTLVGLFDLAATSAVLGLLRAQG